jgi:hypothetical protein
MYSSTSFQDESDTFTSLQSLALSASILNANYLANLNIIQSRFQLPFQPFGPVPLMGGNPMLLSPQFGMYNIQQENPGILGLYQSSENQIPGTMITNIRQDASQSILGPFPGGGNSWPMLPLPEASMMHGDPPSAAHRPPFFPLSRPQSQAEREQEQAQAQESRRCRGRPRGAKDKKPRKRARRRATDTADDDAEGADPRASPPPGDGGAADALQPPGGTGRPSSPAADRSGRHKPWKIVLSAQDALHIYRARETGKMAAAVCTRLAETYAVHAKVSTPQAARLHRFGPPAAAP